MDLYEWQEERKMKKVKIIIAASLLLNISSCNFTYVVAAPSEVASDTVNRDTSEERQNIDTSELQEIVENIQEYDNNIEIKTQKLNDLQKQLDDKEKEIKDNEENIKLLEQNVEDTDKLLGERIKDMSNNGGLKNTVLNYIDALLKSGNILDAVDRLQVISKVCKNDAKLIEEAKEAKQNLQDTKIKIEKEKKQLEQDKNYIKEQLEKLEDEKKKLIEYIKENSSLINSKDGSIIPIDLSSDMDENVRALINEAQKYLGVPYLWGGTSPAGFDCSGLMQYVFNSQGISIPRTSQEQQKASEAIELKDVKPGDLLFNKEKDATHVGMYIGNDLYIQAPHTGDVVKISKWSTSNMKYAGRVID